MEPRYPDITIPLVGEDGNAMVIISRARQIARRAGVPKEELDEFTNEAMSGDYDNVLQTVMRWFDT